MAKNSIRQWSPTAASNLDIASISLAEGVTKPSDVNDFERAHMAQIAQWLAEMSYPTVGGTSDALTLSPTTALAALASNVVYSGAVGATNTTTTPTLAVSSTGAVVIRKIVGGVDVAVAAGDMPAGWPAAWLYSAAANSGSGAWILVNPYVAGVPSYGTGVATWLQTPTSANLAAAVTDETGSGALVFANSPTLVTPALGTPSALVATNATGTAASLTAGVANGLKTATTTVVVSAATAPSSGQVLTATSSTAADWETPTGGLTLITTLTPSVVSSVSLTSIAAGYRKIYLELDALIATSTGASLTLATSSTNGAAYGTAAALVPWTGGAATINGFAEICNVGSTIAAGKVVNFVLATNVSPAVTNNGFATPTNTAAVVNAIQMAVSAGTMTGTIRVYGEK